jgi:hypothetical protein
MAIQRSGPTPPFFEYVCSHALVPLAAPPSPQIMSLVTPGQTLSWIEIPSFQRGISWDIQKVVELLESKSVLLGNVILSQFQVQQGQFPHLPTSQLQFMVLVDGLQRLAVGTAFLRLLHDRVLCPTPSRSGDASYFAPLSARVNALSAFYFHNDVEFQNHPRRAIAAQYRVLRSAVDTYFEHEFNAGHAAEMASQIVPLFLAKQVALDIYFNFNRLDLLGTFIGINTVRVDLGPVDLLRSHLLERATAAGWPIVDSEITENDFTDSLTDEQKPKQMFLPFVNAALRAIWSDSAGGKRLFPSWSGMLLRKEVTDFLDFIDKFESAIQTNNYLLEISECGSLPASIAFAYYYSAYVHGAKILPSFITGGNAEDPELHALLLACYRLILNGTVGKTAHYLDMLVTGTGSLSLTQLADRMSLDSIGKSLSANVDQQWLELELSSIDQKRAPRIFNAMLLPPRSELGGPFLPLRFGRKATQFQVDHLIPDILINSTAPGAREAQSLRNFAPLPTNQNRVAKATSCSSKLSATGIYSNYVTASRQTHLVHSYTAWLLTQASSTATTALDDQSLLEKNSSPELGSQRITKIASDLLSKL